jgi:hypothetical protein
MGTKSYFSHDHEGKGPLQWITEAGVSNPTVWGENIAAGQPDPGGSELTDLHSAIRNSSILDFGLLFPHLPTPGGAFTAWMNSPGHRANIEFPGFTHIGVGHERINPSQYGDYWCQHFIGIAGDTPLPPDPVDPVDPVDPTPTERRWLVSGRYKGIGGEGITPGKVMTFTGASTPGLFEVLTAKEETTPPPDPVDPVDPIPDPAGELEVRPLLTNARCGWNLFVYVKDPLGTVGAAVVTVSGFPATIRMVRHQASLDGRAPATASVKGTPGTPLLIAATAGSRQGQVTVTLGAAGDTPPLLDEVQ